MSQFLHNNDDDKAIAISQIFSENSQAKNLVTSSWTFMVEQNSIAGKHVVCFPIVYNYPVGIKLGNTYWKKNHE